MPVKATKKPEPSININTAIWKDKTTLVTSTTASPPPTALLTKQEKRAKQKQNDARRARIQAALAHPPPPPPHTPTINERIAMLQFAQMHHQTNRQTHGSSGGDAEGGDGGGVALCLPEYPSHPPLARPYTQKPGWLLGSSSSSSRSKPPDASGSDAAASKDHRPSSEQTVTVRLLDEKDW